MKKILLLSIVPALVALFVVHTKASAYGDDKSEITAAENGILNAAKSKDVDKIMSYYAPDESLLVFDVTPPRQYVGAKAYRKDWEDFFAAYPGPAEAEISDLSVTADRTLGYARLITHFTATDKDGQKAEMTVRTTDVFRKIGGKWLIVHEHNSVPVDIATGKADLMSKP